MWDVEKICRNFYLLRREFYVKYANVIDFIHSHTQMRLKADEVKKEIHFNSMVLDHLDGWRSNEHRCQIIEWMYGVHIPFVNANLLNSTVQMELNDTLKYVLLTVERKKKGSIHSSNLLFTEYVL